jgi:HD-GYP domain-containing protein (c-di-GMP phosphodiesterase class II)
MPCHERRTQDSPLLERLIAYAESTHAFITLRKRYPDHADHSVRVTRIAFEVGKLLKFSLPDLSDIILATLFHDCGKSQISEEIIDNPGRLPDEQMAVMQLHVQFSVDVAPVSPRIRAIIALSHTFQKRPYQATPRGEDAEEISILMLDEEVRYLASVLSACDLADVATSDRIYRKAIFEPKAVTSFLSNGFVGGGDEVLKAVLLALFPSVVVAVTSQISVT